MTIIIYEIDKDTLEQVNSAVADMANTTGMTISHYATSVKSGQATLPFTVEGMDDFVTDLQEVEFSVVVRKKIDLTATGVNGNIRKNIGEDVGEYKHTSDVPSRPLDLPPGFTEVYKNK